MGYFFRLAAKDFLYASSNTHAFVIPNVAHWLERERAQWVHIDGLIQ